MKLKHCLDITSQVGVFIHREENIIDVTGGWMTLTFDILDLPEKHAKVARIYKVAVSTELLPNYDKVIFFITCHGIMVIVLLLHAIMIVYLQLDNVILYLKIMSHVKVLFAKDVMPLLMHLLYFVLNFWYSCCMMVHFFPNLLDYTDLIMTRFCTCHNSNAVVACAKFHSDWIS